MRAVSLRRTALFWMTVLLGFVGAAAMLIAYQLARSEAAEFLDAQLRQVALNAGVGLREMDAPPAADKDPEDQIAVTIWRNDTIARTDLPHAQLVRPRQPGYANITIAGEPWRAYATVNDMWTVQVAQREKVRQEIAQSAAVGAAAPILVVIPLSWLVVGWAMNRTLGRLNSLAQELADRSAAAVVPLSLEGVPTEVAPLMEGMNRLIVRLQSAIEAQKRFLSDAAHELRTPLAAMQIQVDSITNRSREGFEEAKTAIIKSVSRASALVNQLLRLARLDELEPPARESVELGPLLLDCASEHVAIADSKGIDLGVRIEEPGRMAGSAAELRTLFVNLIDNAVRYTPPGGKVDVRLYRRHGQVIAEVLDTGPGLPQGAEARIFDRFYRAGPPNVEGTGLGLAIALRIAERHGLSLKVENRADNRSGVLGRVILPL